jgi:hypothetical protein
MEEILNHNTKLSEDEKLMLLKIYSNMLESAKEQDNYKNVNNENISITITPEEYNEMLL